MVNNKGSSRFVPERRGISFAKRYQFPGVLQGPGLEQILQDLLGGKPGPSGYELDVARLLYQDRLVLPHTSSWIPQLLREIPSSVVGGHSGVLKTYRKYCQKSLFIKDLNMVKGCGKNGGGVRHLPILQVLH